MLQLGWKAGTEQYAPDELLDFAIAAEAAGFDSIAASDHFHPVGRERPGVLRLELARRGRARTKTDHARHERDLPDPALSPRHRRAGRRDHRVPRAEALFPGRRNRRSAERVSPRSGHGPPTTTRRAQLAEAIELIRELLTGEKITHKGPYYETRKAKLYTQPERADARSTSPAWCRTAPHSPAGTATA